MYAFSIVFPANSALLARLSRHRRDCGTTWKALPLSSILREGTSSGSLLQTSEIVQASAFDLGEDSDSTWMVSDDDMNLDDDDEETAEVVLDG
jgi:hypothetical protein